MPTFKTTIAYDGTAYAGWQIQANARTIQQVLEKAVARISDQQVRVIGSGRTDAGVHAVAQVASFAVDTRLDSVELRSALNGNLPFDVRVTHVEIVPDDFHAQHDAVGKTYCYVIQDEGIADVFHLRYAWFQPTRLNEVAMHEAGQSWVGSLDFASFQGARSRRETTTRTVEALSVRRGWNGDHRFLRMEVTSNGFLYNMVRNFMGSLQEIGRGNQSVSWAQEVLAARDRRAAGQTAPPHGLYLMNVKYS